MSSRMGFNLFSLVGWKNTFYVFGRHNARFYGFWKYFLKDTFRGVGWLVKIYRLYMKGARANDFPLSKYGLFGEKK